MPIQHDDGSCWPVRRCWPESPLPLHAFVVRPFFKLSSVECNPMNVSHFTVEHVCIKSDKLFDEVAQSVRARSLAAYDSEPGVVASCERRQRGIRSKIEAMVGPSGFPCCLRSAESPRCAAAASRPEAKGNPVRRRQPAVCHTDDAARHSDKPLRPATGVDLPGRRRQNVRRIR